MNEIRKLEYIPILGKVTVNYSDMITVKVVEQFDAIGEFNRLKKINHLGLISHVFPTLNHTRFDYLIFQSVLSELIENNFKGTTSAQGSIKIKGRKYSGNQIIKLWILLSNFGHCKHTIGDEKAMLLYASDKRGFLSTLCKPFSNDLDLVDFSKDIVRKLDYIRFHHIVSLYRIYKVFSHNKTIQNELIDIYKILILPLNKISYISDILKAEQLKVIYKNIRDVSIIALDTQNSHLPINIDILSTILSFDFHFDKFQGRKLSELLNPLTNLLYDNLYLNSKAQTLQRSYEIDSLNEMKTLTYTKIIEKGLNEGLGDPNNCQLTHFVRKEYILDSKQKIKDHFSISQNIVKKSKIYETSIDFNILNRKVVLDFYFKTNGFTKKDFPKLLDTIYRISEIIEKVQFSSKNTINSNLINEINEDIQITDDCKNKIIPKLENLFSRYFNFEMLELNHSMIKNLLWSTIRYHFKDNYTFDIDSFTITDEIGLILPSGKDLLTYKIDNKIKELSSVDLDRVHELNHLRHSIKRRYDGIVIGCIARVKIYDYSLAPDKRIVTDIDSILLKFNANSTVLEFNESKNTSASENDATRDLKNKFKKVLNENSKGGRIEKVTKYGAKYVIRY